MVAIQKKVGKVTDLFDKMSFPEDLKNLDAKQLLQLCEEIRQIITESTMINGGHLATNLGAVEISVALHRVFDLKVDRLILDVGHQCYAHKLLTGRKDKFHTLRSMNGLTGYPNPKESEFDPFVSGHASTSISIASGYAEAFALQKSSAKAIAFIGDGALTGGTAYEGLCYVGSSQKNVLVILNDNRMAISPSTSGLTRYLNSLRTSPSYNEIKSEIIDRLKSFPIFSGQLYKLVEGIHSNISSIMVDNGIFSSLGYKYFGPYDGHDVVRLEEALRKIKRLNRPVLMHILTEKGKGNSQAEGDPERFHGVGPKPKDTIEIKKSPGISFTNGFAETLVELGKADEKIVAITAAMPSGTGIAKYMKEFPNRSYDVGIAEGHAVAMAAAIAKAGYKPVVAIYSTFIQRAVDHVFHEILLQEDCSVFLALDRAGVVGEDGPTHHGLYDIALFRTFPGVVMCSPADLHDMALMMQWGLDHSKTVIMRYPRASMPKLTEISSYPSIESGKGFVIKEGSDVMILAYGSLIRNALDASDILKREGLSVGVSNARFAKPIDRDLIYNACKSALVVTLEEHTIEGGFGAIVSEYIPAGVKHIKIGTPDEFVEHASREQLLKICKLDADSIANTIKAKIQEG